MSGDAARGAVLAAASGLRGSLGVAARAKWEEPSPFWPDTPLKAAKVWREIIDPDTGVVLQEIPMSQCEMQRRFGHKLSVVEDEDLDKIQPALLPRGWRWRESPRRHDPPR